MRDLPATMRRLWLKGWWGQMVPVVSDDCWAVVKVKSPGDEAEPLDVG